MKPPQAIWAIEAQFDVVITDRKLTDDYEAYCRKSSVKIIY